MARRLALLGLVLVAVVWGVSFTVVEDALGTVDALSLVGWRFLVGAVVLALARPGGPRRVPWPVVAHGVALGALLGAGFLACTIGLQTASAASTALVVGATVVLAPAVGWLWGRQRLGGRTRVAAALAVAGLAVVTVPTAAWGSGLGLVLVATLCWSVHLVALQRWAQPGRAWDSALVQLTTVAAAVLLGLVGTGHRLSVPTLPSAVAACVFLGALATGAAFVVLTWAEQHVDATTTAMVCVLEPVVGALAGFVTGEPPTTTVVAGGVLVVAAALLGSVGTVDQPGSGRMGRWRGRNGNRPRPTWCGRWRC